MSQDTMEELAIHRMLGSHGDLGLDDYIIGHMPAVFPTASSGGMQSGGGSRAANDNHSSSPPRYFQYNISQSPAAVAPSVGGRSVSTAAATAGHFPGLMTLDDLIEGGINLDRKRNSKWDTNNNDSNINKNKARGVQTNNATLRRRLQRKRKAAAQRTGGGVGRSTGASWNNDDDDDDAGGRPSNTNNNKKNRDGAGRKGKATKKKSGVVSNNSGSVNIATFERLGALIGQLTQRIAELEKTLGGDDGNPNNNNNRGGTKKKKMRRGRRGGRR